MTRLTPTCAPLGDVRSPYLYLNGVDDGQEAFGGYDPANVNKSQGIKREYDPGSIFYKDQMPGSFKVYPQRKRTQMLLTR